MPVVIVKVISKFFNKPIQIFYDESRDRDIAIYRHIAMAEVLKFSDLSTFKIAQHFKKLDHTTVIYASRKIEKLLVTDQVFNYYIQQLDQEIETSLQERNVLQKRDVSVFLKKSGKPQDREKYFK